MNNSIKKFILFAVILISSFSYAQISVSFNVSTRPTPQISEWENRNEMAILTVTNSNSSDVGMQYKIKAKIYIDNRLVAETRLQDMPIMELPFGSETYLADMIIPYNALDIYDENAQRETITSTGLLPAGNYSFCISLVDLQGGILYSTQEICRPMIITSYQMPELIYPIENIRIPSNMVPSIIFRWTPMSPPPSGQDGIKYLIAVVKVENGQDANQAFLSNYPIIEEEVIGVNQFYFPMDIDVPRDEITHYIWSVKPMMLNDTPYFNQNNGFVSLGDFRIGDEENLYPILDLPTVTTNDDEGELSENDTLHAGLNGEFEITTSTLTESDGKYSGEGTVYINWLKARVNVQFSNITVNTDKHLLSGKIIAKTYLETPTYPQEWAMEAGLNNPWVNTVATDVVQWIESSGINIPYNSTEDFTNPIKVPLGVNLPSGDQIAITEMAFFSDKSEINVVVAKTTPPSWDNEQLIGFKASGIDFRPNTISSGANRLELIDNIEFNVNENLHLTFKKGIIDDTTHPGCYIEFENAEFTAFGMEIEAELSRNWLVPFDDDGSSKTALNIATVAQDWDNMILTGTLPKSKIVGSGGVVIQAEEITYDMSDTQNASNISFPEGYIETTELYRGFFAKNVQITLPEAWEVRNGVPKDIHVRNLIIDNNGISLKAEVNNILEFKEVSIVDLTASVDNFQFEMVSNNLVEASVAGRLALPVSNPNETENPLHYEALFQIAQNNHQSDSVQLTIKPDTINVDLLKGTMSLENTSNITAYIDKNKKKFDINLNGTYHWDNVDLGNPIGKVSMEMDFQNLSMDYDTSKTQEFDFDIGSWSFASPPKKMSGFPITIERISYRRLSANSDVLLKGSLDFDVVVNFTENIGAKATLGIESSIVDKRSENKFRFTPKFDKVNISKAEIHSDTPAVKIDGFLEFRNEDDPVYGKGFKSTIGVNFKSVSLSVNALVEFGNTNYQNNGNHYRYWRVEADAILPPPAIVFLPGLAFRGFGGGAYKNMEPIINGRKYTFRPKKGGWGLKAKTVIATTPKAEIFNTDADLLAHFNGRNGIERIGFEGAFWLGAGLDSRDDAQVNGDFFADYNFPNKHFQFGTTLSFESKSVDATNVHFDLDINGRTNKWFMKFGEPENLNSVNIKDVGVVNQYLMVGNDIPTPHGFSNKFKQDYAAVVGHEPSYSIGNGGVDINSTTGKGFALGANFSFTSEGEQKIWQGSSNRPRKVYVYYDVAAGAELNLSMLQYNGSCAGFSPMGINGWRADGNLGMYAKANLGVKAYNKNGNQYHWSPYNIADINVGAWVQGQFPRPSYAAGRLEGNIGVLGMHIPFNVGFQTGEQCTSGTVDTGVAITQEDATAALDQNLIQYINPSQVRNIPITAPFTIKYAFKPNEVFDIPEQQSNGEVKLRTFKLTYTNHLFKLDSDTNELVEIDIEEETNNLGEVLITTLENQEPYHVPSEMLENITTVFTVADMGIATMPNVAGENANVSSISSTANITTVYPVAINPPAYQIPSSSSFGNGTQVGLGITPLGNMHIGGPNTIIDEFRYPEPLSNKILESNNTPIRSNRLAYNTIYHLRSRAKLREYINGNWDTVVYSSSKRKDFRTERNPNATNTQTGKH